MLTEQILTQCNGCMACYNICPVECIQMEINQEGFWYPKIESEKCIKCNRCSNICPLNMKKSNNEVRVAYAAMHKNLQVRLGSSSGGVFPALAKSILKNKGVVFGPDFDDRWNLHHVAIHNLEDLHKLCGSKYVQSKIGDSYQEVKKYLEEGKRVLFTGTPCQVAGLKQYLRKDYENLICQDIACHGVASPFVLKKYMEFRQKKVRTNVRRMFFRHKKYGWKTFSLLFEYSNNKEYVGSNAIDLYLRMFINNYSLRPSCYQCHFKGLNRMADITLADYWGVWDIEENMDDDLGTSLVILNTEKGKVLWNSIHSQFKCKETDLNKALKYNSALIKSVPCPEKRGEFFEQIQTEGFTSKIDHFQHIGLLRAIKRTYNIKKNKKF